MARIALIDGCVAHSERGAAQTEEILMGFSPNKLKMAGLWLLTATLATVPAIGQQAVETP